MYESHDMRHIGFPQVDGDQRDPRKLGRHSLVSELRYTITCSVLGMGLGYEVIV